MSCPTLFLKYLPILFLFGISNAFLLADTSNWVSLTPQPYERALRNPLKGFTGGSSEWRTLEMRYVRWNDIENHVDDDIEKIRQYMEDRWSNYSLDNRKVIPRVHLMWSHGGQTYWPSDMTTGDYTSEQFKSRVVRLIERLGVLWDNDPRIAFVEVGIVGRWGEHHGPAPTEEVQSIISDAFARSFPNKLASVRHPWREFEPGQFGVYWDSFAHQKQMSGHGRNIAEIFQEDPSYWQRHYIGGEVAYDWGDWSIQPGMNPTASVSQAAHRDFIINTIRWLHATQLRWISNYDPNNAEARAGAELMQKAFGYRFILEEVAFNPQAGPDGSFSVELKVRNEGAAPFYYAWPLQLSLLDPETLEPVWAGIFEGVDIRDWLPGSGWTEPEWTPSTWYESASWPDASVGYANPPLLYSARGEFQADVPAGNYILSLAILDPKGGYVPSVRFATANYLNGGLHPIGVLAVGEGEGGPLPVNFAFDDPFTDDSLLYVVPAEEILPDIQFAVVGGSSSTTVQFDASNSSAHGTTIELYEWDFEDTGSIDATGPVVTHTFGGPGSYVTRLTVRDANGTSNTTTRRLRVPPQTSFGNNFEPWPLPGRIQAEDFDKGGPGVAYLDTTPINAGNSNYRDGEWVDIQVTGDSEGGDYNVGWTVAGEWLEYTVHLEKSGLYRLDFRVASLSNTGVISVSSDGGEMGTLLSVPNTGGWQSYQTLSLDDLYFTAGTQVVRITFSGGDVNLNWWEGVLVAPDQTPTVSFDFWMESLENPPPSHLRAPHHDPLGIGVINFKTFALGGHPMIPGSLFLPSIEQHFSESGHTEGQLSLTYLRAQSGLQYVVEVSHSLLSDSWTSMGVFQGSGEVGSFVTATYSINKESGPVFMRLRVFSSAKEDGQ